MFRIFIAISMAALLSAATLGCSTSRPAAARSVPSAPVVFMIGDSTMANKPLRPAQPERGWGQILPVYLKPGVRVVNLAANGRSSKSFRDEGRWNRVLEELRAGDFVIIQFGHNDQKPDAARHTEPYGSYQANLERYVRETRERNGIPILATPIVRRAFTNGTELIDTHGAYPDAVRALALKQQVPLLDLERSTRELVLKLGPEPSKRLYMWVEPGEYASIPNGKRDDTHLTPHGASRVCDLAIEEMLNIPDLAKWLNARP